MALTQLPDEHASQTNALLAASLVTAPKIAQSLQHSPQLELFAQDATCRGVSAVVIVVVVVLVVVVVAVLVVVVVVVVVVAAAVAVVVVVVVCCCCCCCCFCCC